MKNVTVKLEEDLVRAARHEAVDAGQSLSGWLAELIRERLGRSEGTREDVERGAGGGECLRTSDGP
jgi:hypothetical protein